MAVLFGLLRGSVGCNGAGATPLLSFLLALLIIPGGQQSFPATYSREILVKDLGGSGANRDC